MFYDKVKCRRLREEDKRMIERLYGEGTGIRTIARVLGVYLQTVNYHLKKAMILLLWYHVVLRTIRRMIKIG